MSNEQKTKSDRPNRARSGPEADAKGQSETNHKGGSNDGISSADPRVLSGDKDGDATLPIKPRK